MADYPDEEPSSFRYFGSEAALQGEIARIYAGLMTVIRSGRIPASGACVIAMVNVAAKVLVTCGRANPGMQEQWDRMCKSALERALAEKMGVTPHDC